MWIKEIEGICEWKLADDIDWGNQYVSSCENIWELLDGTPIDNGMKFCPFCGKPLVYIR